MANNNTSNHEENVQSALTTHLDPILEGRSVLIGQRRDLVSEFVHFDLVLDRQLRQEVSAQLLVERLGRRLHRLETGLETGETSLLEHTALDCQGDDVIWSNMICD